MASLFGLYTILSFLFLIHSSSAFNWPPVTNPGVGTVWVIGTQVTIEWDPIAVPPPSPTTTADFILGYFDEDTNEHLDFDNPLGTNVLLTDGKLQITVPNVTPRFTYIVVLLGSTSNISARFTIKAADSTSSKPPPTTNPPSTTSKPTSQTQSQSQTQTQTHSSETSTHSTSSGSSSTSSSSSSTSSSGPAVSSQSTVINGTTVPIDSSTTAKLSVQPTVAALTNAIILSDPSGVIQLSSSDIPEVTNHAPSPKFLNMSGIMWVAVICGATIFTL